VTGPSIETALTALDSALESGERQAAAALAPVRRLRWLCSAGDLAALDTQLAQAPALAERLAETLRGTAEGVAYDAEQACADGSYLAELRAEAARLHPAGLHRQQGARPADRL